MKSEVLPAKDGVTKQAYFSPTLVDFGAVVDLTRSGSVGDVEQGNPANCSQDTNRRSCLPSDVRLKTDVKLFSRDANGLARYVYRYDEALCPEMKPQWYAGYMAHEVAALYPEAVSAGANGYLQVDYSLIPQTRFH